MASTQPPAGLPLERGATVEATDGPLGTVTGIANRPGTNEPAYLLVRHASTDEQLALPFALIDHVPTPREVFLRVGRQDAMAQAERSAGLTGAREHLVIPLAEERLVAEARPADLGELRIHKGVELAEAVASTSLVREELSVERVPVNRPVDGPTQQRVEGDTLIIPVFEEVLVVHKQLMLKEEVRIRTRRTTEQAEVRETVRRERVTFDDQTRGGRVNLPAREASGPPAQPERST